MNAKPVAALLTAVVCLQVYCLLRLKDIDNEMESLRRAQENQAYGVERQLEAMWSQLSDLADSKRWYAVNRADVLPNASCQSAEARVEWELREWTPGSNVRFLYRLDADAAWQETAVAELGGLSYAASFPITVPLVLDWDVDVSGSRIVEDPESLEVFTPPERTAPRRQVEYQIVVEEPDETRSTGELRLDWGEYSIFAEVQVRTDINGPYSTTLLWRRNENSCTALESAEIRVYRKGSLVQTVPLERTAGGPPHLTAKWRNKEQPDRLEVVVRYAGQEQVIPVEF